MKFDLLLLFLARAFRFVGFRGIRGPGLELSGSGLGFGVYGLAFEV